MTSVRSFAAQDVVGAEHRGERPGLGAPAGRAGLGAAPAPAAPGDARRGLGAEAGPGPGDGGGGAAGGLGFRAAGGAAAPADDDAEDSVVLPTEFGRMCGPSLSCIEALAAAWHSGRKCWRCFAARGIDLSVSLTNTYARR